MEKADEGGAPPLAPEPRSFAAGQECDECEKKIAMACLPCDFGGCAEHAEEHNRSCPEEPHHHGSSPWSAECVECERMTSRFNRDVAEERERGLKAEIGRLQDAWFCDETIAPDGNLRALVSRTVARAAEAEAVLFRIHKLSDPNRVVSVEPLAGLARRYFEVTECRCQPCGYHSDMANRIRSHLVPFASGEPPAGPSSTSNHSQEGRE